MRRILVLIVAVGLVSVAVAGTAAAGPGSDKWFDETIPDIGLCDFRVALHSSVHEVTNGRIEHWNGHETFINPATGTAYRATWSESWRYFIKDGQLFVKGSGSLWKLTVPGHGVVLIDSGYRLYELYDEPPYFALVKAHGPSFWADQAVIDAFCELME